MANIIRAYLKRNSSLVAGVIAVISGAVSIPACGNAEFSWVVTNLTEEKQKSTDASNSQKTAQLSLGPTLPQKGPGPRLGGGKATGTGVTAYIWINPGATQASADGVKLRNVSIK